MRFTHFILFLFISFVGWAQSSNDTVLHKRVLDSLEQEIFRYKDSTRRLTYEANVITGTSVLDTVCNGKDSVLILFYNSNRRVLKRHVTYLAKDGCIIGEKTEYMNIEEKPEFEVTYDAPCYTKAEIIEIEKDGSKAFRKMTFYYTRYKYDSKGRVVERFFWYPRVTVRRFTYTYYFNGETTSTSVRIKEREFWD
jgi:hypothetical protein